MNVGAVLTSAGSVHVALWGNGAVPFALKCHETGALLCVCILVGNLPEEPSLSSGCQPNRERLP